VTKLFDELKEGLESALDYAKGKGSKKVRVQVVEYVSPAPLSAASIRSLRVSLGKTQELFAQLLGVSKKTVEAWEAGTKKPNGSVLRLFQILQSDPEALESVSFKREGKKKQPRKKAV
jgi:putative transcriptional regulator